MDAHSSRRPALGARVAALGAASAWAPLSPRPLDAEALRGADALVACLGPEGDAEALARWILAQPGMTEVYDRQTAAEKCELPADRIGDLVVLAGRDFVIGRTPADHDLSQLGGMLRSHGGRYEEMVPLVLSEPLNSEYAALAACDPRNFDIFQFTCNGAHK